jgi:nucleoside-diphosphate kinase
MNTKTLVLIKPDGLKKSLTGNILTRLSETHLRIIAAKVVHVSKELAEEHYGHLRSKPFFNDVVKYLMGDLHGEEYSRVMALVYKGDDAIGKVRKLAGSTNPEEADATSIRGQYGRLTTKGLFENVLHCSDAEDSAEKEIKLWFQPDEVVEEIYPSKIIEVTKKTRVWK